MKKYENILKNDKVLIELSEFLKDNNFCSSFYLTGGAVVDIIDGRKPKDYDIITKTAISAILKKSLDTPELVLLYTSRTALTFMFKEKHIIQILKRNESSFKFTIEQSMFNIKDLVLYSFCVRSYESKLLIPNDSIFEDDEEVVTQKDFKIRIKKWESKGFNIHKITKQSYLGWCKKDSPWQVIKDWFKKNNLIINSDEDYDS